ncbi:nicotinate-nucleotide--dimethylbenzimidazole phosphoribosyltransferase [Deferribacterales bacterium RsTz2092]
MKLNNLSEIKSAIKPVDDAFYKKAQEHTLRLAMPVRAMGELNNISERLATIQKTLKPDVSRGELFIVAGDHGVYEEGVAPYPQEVTKQIMDMMVAGHSSVCVYAKHANLKVTLIDLGAKIPVKAPASSPTTYYDCNIARGANNISKGPAMTREQAERAIITAFNIASEHIEKNKLNIVTTGEMGVANTTPTAAMCSVFLGEKVEDVTGAGSGLDEAGRRRKIATIERAIYVNKPDKSDAVDVLAKVGGYELAGMAGVILAAVAHSVPVVLDGYICSAAAVAAAIIAPASKGYMLAGHEGEERGHKYLLKHLGLIPILRLNMRLGEGTGAVCAIPIVRLAAATISEIALLSDAGIESI